MFMFVVVRSAAKRKVILGIVIELQSSCFQASHFPSQPSWPHLGIALEKVFIDEIHGS